MSSYYRDWNLVVYEWLYAYVYTDVARITRSRVAGVVAVFFVQSHTRNICSPCIGQLLMSS